MPEIQQEHNSFLLNERVNVHCLISTFSEQHHDQALKTGYSVIMYKVHAHQTPSEESSS